MRLALALALAGLGAPACRKVIGDGCSTSTDCSLQGDRICDTSQFEGYCTVQNCSPGSCPDNGVCVSFDAHSPRLQRRFCMAGCKQDSDCRQPNYRCLRPSPAACVSRGVDLLPPGETCDLMIDRSSQYIGWCSRVATSAPLTSGGDGGGP